MWPRTYNLENTLYFKNVRNQGRKVSGPYYEEIVMKTPKKVIEKISLPLMFVTFVMAVLVFAVSPVSAAPDLCGPGDFCDQDSDDLIRNHKKCEACSGEPDLDDDCDNNLPACDVVSSDGDIYTAELIIALKDIDGLDVASSGAFRFADGPIPVIIGRNPKDLGLVPRNDSNVVMWRPDAIWEACLYEKVEGVWIPDWSAVAFDQEIWDRMFEIGCPELEPKSHVKEDEGFEDKPIGSYIDHIISTADDWNFSEPGNYRLILRDIRLTAEDGVAWDVTMQLLAHGDDYDYIRGTGAWLPDESDPPDVHEFFLVKGKMWGREVSGGGPGGRKSCHQAYSGTDESMEGFSLCTMVEGTCANEADATMQIAICDAACFANIP